MRSVSLALCMLLVSGVAFAQSPAPSSAPDQGQTAAPTAAAPATSAPSGSKKKAAANPRRAQCQQDGRAKGLKGADLRSSVKDCVAAARTSCQKQAGDQNLKGAARKSFMSTCAG